MNFLQTLVQMGQTGRVEFQVVGKMTERGERFTDLDSGAVQQLAGTLQSGVYPGQIDQFAISPIDAGEGSGLLVIQPAQGEVASFDDISGIAEQPMLLKQFIELGFPQV